MAGEGGHAGQGRGGAAVERAQFGHFGQQDGDNIRVNTDLFDPAQDVTIDRKQIESIEPSTTSPMPTGLLSVLKPDEILDLMAYVLSGGDSGNWMFKRAAGAAFR